MLETKVFNEVLDFVDEMNDQQLKMLMEAAVDRRKIIQKRIARQTLAMLEPDARVMIATEGIKPRYLAGQLGTVNRIEGNKVHVKLDRGPQGKFRTGTVICPAAMLVKL